MLPFSAFDGARVLKEVHVYAFDCSTYHEITAFLVDAINEARLMEHEAKVLNRVEGRTLRFHGTVGITTKDPAALS